MKFSLLFAALFLSVPGPVLSQPESSDTNFRSMFAVEILEFREGNNSIFGAVSIEGDQPLDISEYSLNMIAHFEGWFPDKYDDPAGYCTIGYGRLFAKKLCSDLNEREITRHVTMQEWENGISKARGLDLLSEDILISRRFVTNLVESQITNDQFSALVSFTFNVGGGNMQRSTLLRKVNANDLEGATREFPRWVRAGGVVLPGLQVRRSCEASLFSGSLANRTTEEFSRAECRSFGAVTPSNTQIDIENGE